MADIFELMRDTPARLRAAELLAAAPLAFAIPMDVAAISPKPPTLGLLRDVVTAESYMAIREAIAAELERLTDIK